MCERLEGVIGIKGCGQTITPSFRYYINDYPGITLQAASHVANGEQVQGITLLEDVIERAYRQSMNDLVGEVAKLGNQWIGQQIDYGGQTKLTDTVISAGHTSEIEIYLCGQYQKATLKEMKVYAHAVGVLTVVTENHEITSTDYNLQEGLNTIEINETIIGDTTLKVTANVDTNAYYWGSTAAVCGCECQAYSNNFALYLSKYCDLCEIAYQYRDSLANVFYLKSAIFFFEEALVTPNQSQERRHALDVANKALIYLLGGVDNASGLYVKGKYPAALKIAAQQLHYEINKGKIPCCFSCEGSQIVYNIP